MINKTSCVLLQIKGARIVLLPWTGSTAEDKDPPGFMTAGLKGVWWLEKLHFPPAVRVGQRIPVVLLAVHWEQVQTHFYIWNEWSHVCSESNLPGLSEDVGAGLSSPAKHDPLLPGEGRSQSGGLNSRDWCPVAGRGQNNYHIKSNPQNKICFTSGAANTDRLKPMTQRRAGSSSDSSSPPGLGPAWTWAIVPTQRRS